MPSERLADGAEEADAGGFLRELTLAKFASGTSADPLAWPRFKHSRTKTSLPTAKPSPPCKPSRQSSLTRRRASRTASCESMTRKVVLACIA